MHWKSSPLSFYKTIVSIGKNIEKYKYKESPLQTPVKSSGGDA